MKKTIREIIEDESKDEYHDAEGNLIDKETYERSLEDTDDGEDDEDLTADQIAGAMTPEQLSSFSEFLSGKKTDPEV